jgi:elongation factor G
MTGGEGSYSMELSHYDPAPANIQKELVSHFKQGED